MRKNITERYFRVMTYQPVDRVPDIEFGYWPQTLRRWLKEGMPVGLSDDEKNSMFPKKVDDFFGIESHGHGVPIKIHMNPCFTEEVLEKRGDVTVMRDTSGTVAERYMNDVEESSIPHFIKFPVETPDDWKDMKRRHRVDDPTRVVMEKDMDAVRAAAAGGSMTSVWLVGIYAILRSWMGMENLSFAFYDYPDMIHDMVGDLGRAVRHADRAPAARHPDRPRLVVGGHGGEQRPPRLPEAVHRVPHPGLPAGDGRGAQARLRPLARRLRRQSRTTS